MTLLIIITLITIPVSASSATITVQSYSAAPNSVVSLPIELSGNTGIEAMQLYVEYDSALILTGVEKGSALSTLTYNQSGNKEIYPFILMWNGMSEDSSNGTLATLKFTVPNKEGKYNVRVYSKSGMIYDHNLNDIGVEFVDGVVSVTNEKVIPSPSPSTNPVTTDKANIQVSQVKTTSNAEISVDIMLNNNPGIMALQMYVEYDSGLKLKSVSKGDCLSKLDYMSSGTMETYPFVLLWNGLDIDNSNGKLVTLTFQAPQNEGEYTVHVYSKDGMIYNSTLENVDVAFTDGKIMVDNTVHVDSISINPTALNLFIGDTATIEATVLPEKATNKNVKWTTGNAEVATVSNGNVTAVGVGETTITAVSEDGLYKATCNVSVSASDDNVVDSGEDANGILWSLDSNGVLKISGMGKMEDYSKPASIPWYAYRNEIKEVFFDEGITHIATRAMYNCTSLQKAYIARSVVSIGNLGFGRCDDVSIYGYKGTYAETYANDYELPFVEMTIDEEKKMTVDFVSTSKRWYFDISLKDCTEAAMVYLAIYDENNRLLSVKMEDFAIDDITSFEFSKIDTAAYFKAFILNSNLCPLCDSYKDDL